MAVPTSSDIFVVTCPLASMRAMDRPTGVIADVVGAPAGSLWRWSAPPHRNAARAMAEWISLGDLSTRNIVAEVVRLPGGIDHGAGSSRRVVDRRPVYPKALVTATCRPAASYPR